MSLTFIIIGAQTNAFIGDQVSVLRWECRIPEVAILDNKKLRFSWAFANPMRAHQRQAQNQH